LRPTDPIFVIVTDDALLVFQTSVEPFPVVIVVGDAVRVHVGAFCMTTTTVVVQVTVPPGPLATNV
jgi:hypothetical protein